MFFRRGRGPVPTGDKAILAERHNDDPRNTPTSSGVTRPPLTTTTTTTPSSSLGARLPRAAGPRAPHLPSHQDLPPLQLSFVNDRQSGATTPPVFSSRGIHPTTSSPLPRSSPSSDSPRAEEHRTPLLEGKSWPDSEMPRARTLTQQSISPSETMTNTTPIEFGGRVATPTGSRSSLQPATPSGGRKLYRPGSFGGRRSVLSNLTDASSSSRHTLIQTHLNVQDGEHVVGNGHEGRYSSCASSTLSPLDDKESRTSNPYRMSHIGEAYYTHEPEEDDWLHDVRLLDGWRAKRKIAKGKKPYDFDKKGWRTWCCCSIRGIGNFLTICILSLALVGVLMGYPVTVYFWGSQHGRKGGFGLGGTNATGQIASWGEVRHSLIDADTPKAAMTKVSLDGKTRMNLVFSDEFNVDGRSFYAGDDPIWEALDQWYWETGDYEWYDEAAVTTANGSLVISLTEHRSHNKNFRSGALATWNKLCFQGGLLEARVIMPGDSKVPAYWPAIWTMGNLGRAGFGATTDGTWPYLYEACDVGALPNQTWPTSKGGGPEAALTTGSKGRSLSYLPGQKFSSCTCPGEDHPGPVLADGSFAARGAPELDLFEGASAHYGAHTSLSLQAAPFNAHYEYNMREGAWFDEQTRNNSYKGGIYQQSISATHTTDPSNFQLAPKPTYITYSVESRPGKKGSVTWAIEGKKVWSIDFAKGLQPDGQTEISSRYLTREPMYVIINLAMSSGFSHPDWPHINFPGKFMIDWIRLYQNEGEEAVGCDPPDYPTKDYIERHWEAYHNANLTTWTEPKGLRAGYGHSFPKNRLLTKCT